MNLFDIRLDIDLILSTGLVIDPETGEVLDTSVEETLAALEVAENDKIESIACYIKNLETMAASIKAEEQAMAKRRKAHENRAAWFRSYLDAYMTAAGKTKFEAPRCALFYRASSSVDVVDEAALPAAFVNEVVTVKVDKAGIKKAFAEGEEIPGAVLVTKKHLQIK